MKSKLITLTLIVIIMKSKLITSTLIVISMKSKLITLTFIVISMKSKLITLTFIVISMKSKLITLTFVSISMRLKLITSSLDSIIIYSNICESRVEVYKKILCNIIRLVLTGLILSISGIYYHISAYSVTKIVPLELKYKFALFIMNEFLS